MKKEYTHVSFLLDRSGSMEKLVGDTIGGFNKFLKDQKVEKGKCTFSLVQFDHEYKKVHEFEDIKKVNKLTKSSYIPRGSTSLLDSIGRLAVETGEKLSNMDEKDRPEKVLFITLTDGLENTSKEYTADLISDKVKHQEEKYNWKFVYLGANQDAIKVSSEYGISRGNTMSMSPTSIGTCSAYDTLSKVVTKSRGVDVRSFAAMNMIDDEDRKKQEEAEKSK